MADSMVMVAPVDLLSIIHQAAERPIPPQLFGAGEVPTPELQAQMLELHLQRQQLMAATAQQLHKLQQRMRILHSAAAWDSSSQQRTSAWQPPLGEASAAAAATRQTNCSGEKAPTTASSTQRHSAAEDSPTAVDGSGLPATEASPSTAGGTADTANASTPRAPEWHHQPGAAAAAAAGDAPSQDLQPASSARQGREQAHAHAAGKQHAGPQHGSAAAQHASAAVPADTTRQPEPPQQPALQVQRSPTAASGWVLAQSKAHRKSQQQRERTAAAAKGTGAEAAPVTASRAPPNPNRYAMLPESDSPSGPLSLHDVAALPPSNEAAVQSAAAASAVSAPSSSTCLTDAAVQTPRLLMLPRASAGGGPDACDASTAAAGAGESAGAGKPGAAALGDAVDMSPPHPSTPRQPADGAAVSGAERGSGGAADGSPADARAASSGAARAAAAEDGIVSSFQGRAGGFQSAGGPGSSSLGADDDSASQSTPAASLASASDDGNGTRAERQRQRQRAKQGRQRAAKRLEAERQQEEEALLAAAAKDRAEGLAEQQRQQRQREEGLLQESAALQASLKREQDAQHQKRRLAAGAGRQMPLFAVRPMLDGSHGGSNVGAFRFEFPVPKQPAE